MTIRAHFDGKVIVPDEPVTIPATPVTVHVETSEFIRAEDATQEQRKAAFNSFLVRAKARTVPHLADEDIHPNTIYED